jgi:hypothetical protein
LIGLLVFIMVRGLAEAEPFDLLLLLWLIAALSIGTAGPTGVGELQSDREKFCRKSERKLAGQAIGGSLQV